MPLDPPRRGLRGLGLLNLLQVYEGLGDTSGQARPGSGTLVRDPDAERLLLERGFRDVDPESLCVAAPAAALAAHAMDQDDESPDAVLCTSAVDGLTVEDSLVLTSLDALYQRTQEDVEAFLAEQLHASWRQDKAVRPMLDLAPAPLIEPALGGDAESAAGNSGAGWQGREAELALQVRRMADGWCGASEVAERFAQVEVDGRRQQGGHPQQAITLVYRLARCLQLPPPLMSSTGADELDPARASRPMADAGDAGGGARGPSAAAVGSQVYGVLGFLEEQYWEWLRFEWLPSVLASGADRPVIRNECLALDLVAAWVNWFLGSKPLPSHWEYSDHVGSKLTPLWAQVFFLLRTGHHEEAAKMAERFSQHAPIRRALRAWVESKGMHRVGLVDTDGDGLLDDRLSLQVDTDFMALVVSSDDIWMRAVYLIVNERLDALVGSDSAGGRGGGEHVGLRDLPSLYGLSLASLRRLPPSVVADTRGKGWGMVWCHMQDIVWRHLVFVRPDAPASPFSLRAVQAEVAVQLALDDDSPLGFAGMDAELPRAVLRKAPFVKVLGSLTILRFAHAVGLMDAHSLTPAPPLPPPLEPIDTRIEALHLALALEPVQIRDVSTGLNGIPARAADGLAPAGRWPDAGADLGVGPTLGLALGAGLTQLSARIEECIFARVSGARAQGPAAVRAAVERAVDYALVLRLPAQRQVLLGKLLLLTETETDVVQQALEARERARRMQQQRFKRSDYDDWSAGALLQASAVSCAELLLSQRSPAAPEGAARVACLVQHRLIGASTLFLRARALPRFFAVACELASAVLREFEEADAQPFPVQAGRGSSVVDEAALGHCLMLRQRLEEMPCIMEWSQERSEHAEAVEAWNTLLLLIDAHQLAASGSHGEAVDMLLRGRFMGQHPNPVTYAGFLSSWRFRCFLPVVGAFDNATDESIEVEQAARVLCPSVCSHMHTCM